MARLVGVDLPRDKRLRALCESVLEDPARWVTLDDAARHVGASARTIASTAPFGADESPSRTG